MSGPGGADADSVHMTRPQAHTEDRSGWPALAAAGLVVVAVGLTVAPWLAAAGVAVIVAAVLGVAREVNPPRPRAAPEAPAQGEGGGLWRRFSKQAWLGVGISLSAGMAYVTILRAFSAHALFLPDLWPPPARDLATPVAWAGVFAFAGSLLAAAFGARSLRHGARAAGLGGLGAALLLGAAFLATVGVEWARLASEGFVPWQGEAASGYYAVTGFHALSALGGLAMLAILTWHVADRRLGEKRDAALAGAVVFWTFAAGAWVATFVLVHLRALTWEGQVLL